MSNTSHPDETKAAASQAANKPHQTAAARLQELEARIAEIYTTWIDPDKGEGGTFVSIDKMLQQIDEVLEHNLDYPGRGEEEDDDLEDEDPT